MTTTYRVGSACAGYGGLDMAIEQALAALGIVTDTAWFVEYDAGASATLAHHWPDVPNLHDATTIDWAQAEVIDLFCAGYSCQPFSLAGRRKGADDERHVWPYLAIGAPDEDGAIERPGAIAALRPRLVVFENVAGHLTLGFDTVLADLHRLGYDVYWTLWNASDEGAPHRRRRLFILGVRRAQAALRPSPARVVARHDEHDGWIDPDGGLFGAIPFTGRIPATGAQIDGDMIELAAPSRAGGLRLLPTPRTSDSTGAGVHGNGGMDLRTAISLLPTPAAGNFNDGESVESWKARLLATPTASIATGGPPQDSRGKRDLRLDLLAGRSVTAADWGPYGPAIRRWEAILGRPAPAPTMTGARGGQQLSPAFVEWMMGLPSGHVCDVPGQSRAEKLKRLGNGVVPQQGAAAIGWLAARAGLDALQVAA